MHYKAARPPLHLSWPDDGSLAVGSARHQACSPVASAHTWSAPLASQLAAYEGAAAALAPSRHMLVTGVLSWREYWAPAAAPHHARVCRAASAVQLRWTSSGQAPSLQRASSAKKVGARAQSLSSEALPMGTGPEDELAARSGAYGATTVWIPVCSRTRLPIRERPDANDLRISCALASSDHYLQACPKLL